MDGPHSSYPRKWSRSVSNLSSEMEANSIASELRWRWSNSEYPVHIQILGGLDDNAMTVVVWNSTGIKESEIAYPSDHAGSADPIASAALEQVELILNRLKSEGKL